MDKKNNGGLTSGLSRLLQPFGIQQVVFPSKTLGIAVGMGTVNPTSPIVQDFTTFPQANPQTPTGLPSSPNILISKDNGASWHQVTGVPSYARTQVQKFYDPRGPVLFPLAVSGKRRPTAFSPPTISAPFALFWR